MAISFRALGKTAAQAREMAGDISRTVRENQEAEEKRYELQKLGNRIGGVAGEFARIGEPGVAGSIIAGQAAAARRGQKEGAEVKAPKEKTGAELRAEQWSAISGMAEGPEKEAAKELFFRTWNQGPRRPKVVDQKPGLLRRMGKRTGKTNPQEKMPGGRQILRRTE